MTLLTTQVNRGTFAIGARNSDNRRLPPRKTMRLFLRPEYIRGRNANVQGESLKALRTVLFRYFYPRMSGGLETSHFRQQPETEEQAMPELALLSVSDLNTTVNHQPRLLDTIVGKRLGYNRPRVIRELIERCKDELETYGSIAVRHGAYRGHETTEYYLNEGQCLVLCALSRTPQAAAVRKAIIEVFMAHRRGVAEAAPAITGRDPIVPIRMMQAVGVEYIADKMMTMDKSRDARLAVLEQRLTAIEGWLGRAPRLNQAVGRAK